MLDQNEELYTAFKDENLLAQGTIAEVTLQVKKQMEKTKHASILVFDDETGKVVDLDLRDLPPADAKAGPGRPKLGVIAREVTLLPRHWDWLTSQPGGASITLRKLVEEAKKKSTNKDKIRMAQETTYKFMNVMAGDREGYEEALRALYAQNSAGFKKQISDWPKDIKDHLKKLSVNAWLKV